MFLQYKTVFGFERKTGPVTANLDAFTVIGSAV